MADPDALILPRLLQMERECDDFSWLWQRWNGVPSECRTSYVNVIARRGKFLQLACASRDASLVQAVHRISQLSQYRQSEKWRFVDAVHYGVEYQLYELLPSLDAAEEPNRSDTQESLLMNMALCNGDLRTAKWLYEHRPSVRKEEIPKSTQAALGRHSLELLQWVRAHYPSVFSQRQQQQQVQGLQNYLSWVRKVSTFLSAGDEAVACGNSSVLQYLHANNLLGRTCSREALVAAAVSGHLETLQFLHEHHIGKWTADVMDGAAANGHLDIVRFLHKSRSEGCTQQAMDRAARNGHLPVLEFLDANRAEGYSARAIIDAAANGHVKVVDFLTAQHEQYLSSVPSRAMSEAARNNHRVATRMVC